MLIPVLFLSASIILKNIGVCYRCSQKLGSGKRTLAAQIAIRIAKKDTKLKIKIVEEGDLLSSDLESMQSTILVIHNPVKTWFTSKHTDKIMSCLLKLCTKAKKK